MMKINYRNLAASLCTLVALAAPMSALALTGGPDAGGYTFVDSAEPTLSYDYKSIAHIDNSIDIALDDRSVAVPLGFFFTFYGKSYNTVYVSSNGHIDFTLGYGNDNMNDGDLEIPSPSTPAVIGSDGNDNGWGMNPLIAPYFDDLSVALTGSDVYAFTSGTAPDRTFIVQWHDMPHYSCPATSEPANRMTVQAVLYEGANDIKFLYPDVISTCPLYSAGASATVGIDYDGSVGLQYSANTASLANGLAVAFVPGGDAAISQSPAAIDFGTLQTGNASRALLRLENTGDQMLFVFDTTTLPTTPFSVVSDNCTGSSVLARSYCTVTVEYSPLTVGAHSDSITFDSSDSLTPAITINLGGTGASSATGADISLEDPTGALTDLQSEYGSIPIFTTVTKTFTLKNDGDAALDITFIGPIQGDYTLLADTCTGSQVAVGGSCTFDMSLTPEVPGIHGGLFNVVSSDADESPLAFFINASAYYDVVPNITASDSVLPADDHVVAFANTLQGTTALANITVGNNGTDTLVVTSYNDPAAPFMRQSETCTATTLLPGETCTVTVAYSPSTVDSFSDTIGIISNDPSHSTLDIALVANSVSNPPAAPILVYPGLDATGIPTELTFRWERSSDPDGDVVTYEHYYTTEAGYIANGNSFAGVTANQVAKARADAALYASALAAPGVFLLTAIVMAGPMGSRRKIIAGLLVVAFMFLLVMACGNGISGDRDGPVPGQAVYNATGLSNGTSYYWQVHAVDSHGERTPSATWRFTTAP